MSSKGAAGSTWAYSRSGVPTGSRPRVRAIQPPNPPQAPDSYYSGPRAAAMSGASSVASHHLQRVNQDTGGESLQGKKRPSSATARLNSPSMDKAAMASMAYGPMRAVQENHQQMATDASVITEITRQTINTAHRMKGPARSFSGVSGIIPMTTAQEYARGRSISRDGSPFDRQSNAGYEGQLVYADTVYPQQRLSSAERHTIRSTAGSVVNTARRPKSALLSAAVNQSIGRTTCNDFEEPEALKERLGYSATEITRLKQEVIALSTDKSRLEAELIKRDRDLQILQEGRGTSIERHRLMQQHSRNKIVVKLKEDIIQLKAALAEREAEVASLQRSHRSTSLMEMANAKEEFYNEVQRLRKILGHNQNSGYAGGEQVGMIKALQEEVVQLRRELQETQQISVAQGQSRNESIEVLKGVIWAQHNRIEELKELMKHGKIQKKRGLSPNPTQKAAGEAGIEILRAMKLYQEQNSPKAKSVSVKRAVKKRQPKQSMIGDTSGMLSRATFSSMGNKAARPAGIDPSTGGHVREVRRLRTQHSGGAALQGPQDTIHEEGGTPQFPDALSGDAVQSGACYQIERKHSRDQIEVLSQNLTNQEQERKGVQRLVAAAQNAAEQALGSVLQRYDTAKRTEISDPRTSQIPSIASNAPPEQQPQSFIPPDGTSEESDKEAQPEGGESEDDDENSNKQATGNKQSENDSPTQNLLENPEPVSASEFCEAAKLGRLEELRKLFTRDPTILNEKDQSSDGSNFALICATENRHVDCVRFLLESNAKFDVRASNEDTALMRAAGSGSDHCLKILIEAGADVNAQNADMDTALHKAACEGKERCLQMLIQANADLEATNNNLQTALHVAAYNGKEQCATLLLQAGASITSKDNCERTALMQAREQNFFGLAELIEQEQEKIEAENAEKEKAEQQERDREELARQQEESKKREKEEQEQLQKDQEEKQKAEQKLREMEEQAEQERIEKETEARIQKEAQERLEKENEEQRQKEEQQKLLDAMEAERIKAEEEEEDKKMREEINNGTSDQKDYEDNDAENSSANDDEEEPEDAMYTLRLTPPDFDGTTKKDDASNASKTSAILVENESGTTQENLNNNTSATGCVPEKVQQSESEYEDDFSH